MIIYTYQCKCEHIFDAWASIEKHASKKCPECGKRAKQILTPSHLDYLGMGVSTSMPTSADKWAKMHEQAGKRESGDSPPGRFIRG